MSSNYVKLPQSGASVDLSLPLDVSNSTADVVGDASVINTGNINTVGLIVEGSLQSSIPAAVTFSALFTSSINATYALGSVTGTATGGASASGGRLNVAGDTLKYVTYSAVLSADMAQILAVQFKYTPAYTGAPGGTQTLFSIFNADSSEANLISAYITTGGYLDLAVHNAAGDNLFIATVKDLSSDLVSGTPIELEFNINLTAGATTSYVNGVKENTNVTTGTRSTGSTLLRIGASPYTDTTSDGYFDDFTIFNTTNHTAATYDAPTDPVGAVEQIANLVEFRNAADVLLASINADGEYSYTPADETKWADPNPTTVNEALDRMAALMYALNTNTEIP